MRFFVNVGTLGRRTPGTAVVDVPAINTGTINPASGGIRFNDAGDDVTGDVMDGPEVTPNGRILTDHASIQRRNPERDIDLFLIDEIIEDNEPEPTASGNDRYYDPDEDVSVITEPGGEKVITVYIGYP